MDHEKRTGDRSADRALIWIRRGIWLYLWLLIFEGALRKWVLPIQLNGMAALARDPLVIAIYWLAFQSRRIVSPAFFPIGVLGIAMTALASLQVALSGLGIPIALYGLHAYILHLPLIFVIQNVLAPGDLAKIGRLFLLFAAPMTILLAAQFRATPSDWLNRGRSGEFGQIDGALGHIRAAGTFSYGTGVSEFFPIVEAFVISRFIRAKKGTKTLASVAACATLLAMPFSVSRTLLFWTCFVLAAALVIASRRVKALLRLTSFVALLLPAGILLSQFASVQESLATFGARWDSAMGDQQTAGVLADRLVGPVLGVIGEIQRSSLIGQGIGLGSGFASSVMTGTRDSFLLAETEGLRLIQEAGLLGLVFYGVRIAFCLKMLYASYNVAGCSPLPFLLAAATAPNLIFNNMEQPTNLGFMIFGSGLALAAISQALGTRRRRNRVRTHVKVSEVSRSGIAYASS
jgi:hypothetical protein